MRRIRSKITYANVVATLALFIALGGVSYAAVKLPANSVGEKQIKKNAVVGKKIKKNAITGDKIKPGTIKGTDITLASLGKVPSAAAADSAGVAATTDQLMTVAKRVGPSFSGGASQDDARQQATPVPLVAYGQVSVYGKCYLYSGQLYVELFEKTTADGALSALYSYDYYYGSNQYLNTATPEGDRQIYYTSASNNNSTNMSSPYYGEGTLFGPDGNALNFDLNYWVKQGNVATYGNGAYGPGNVCIFTGTGVKLPAN
ncbi:MAG: hypothetical protein ACRDKE_08815 [Solirubrobacterales bacterium]